MKFKDYPIHQEIKDQLDRLGFVRPTDIQYRAIQPISVLRLKCWLIYCPSGGKDC
jgi:hypothetical protein